MTGVKVLGLLMGLGSIATAADFGCTASASLLPFARGEGFTELTGDIVVSCSGGSPTLNGQNIPQANLTITLNTPITSRLIGNSTTNSEALLLIDEPGSAANPARLACGSVSSGCAVTGTSPSAGAAGPEPFNGATGRPNIFQGAVSGYSITFTNVPIDPPGSGTRIYRFTNIRSDASAVAPAGAGAPAQVVALLAVSGSANMPVTNPSQTVALVQSGAAFSLRDGSNTGPLPATGFVIQQNTAAVPSGSPAAYLRFSESWTSAFKTRTAANATDANTSPAPQNQNVPGVVYASESGYTFAIGGTTAGLADFGTRLKAVFNDLPTGLRVFAGTVSSVQGHVARLVSSETGAFAAASSSTSIGGLAVTEIQVSSGTATAVWEVLSADPNALETFDLPVWFSGTNPVLGTGTVSLSMAPAPPAFSAANGERAQGASFAIPRFAVRIAPVNVVQVAASTTPAVLLSSNPASLIFSYQLGGGAPAAQTLTISATGTTTVPNFVILTNGAPWLFVSAAGGSPPTVSAVANPAGLGPGVYNSSIALSAAGVSNSPLMIPVTLTVTGPPVTLSSSKTISHIADGAGWRTTVILVNLDAASSSFTLRFWDEQGNPWRLPLGPDGFQTQITDTIPGSGSRSIQTDGFFSALSVGSAELITNGSIGGTAVFALQIPGQPDTEAAVPITTIRGRRFLLPFDSSPGFATGVAVANPNASQNAAVSVVFRNETGQITGSLGPINMSPRGHFSFVVPSGAGAKGVAEFTSTGADMAGLGIRSHGRAFTSVETQASVPAGDKTISHIADGGGWKTTIVLVNTDSQPAPFTLRFRRDNGNSLTLPLGSNGRVSSISGTIPAGSARTIETDGTATDLITGWAELSTSFAIGGTAIFGAKVPGQPDSEAAVPIISNLSGHFDLPFDGSTGFGTGVAFANPSSASARISVLFRDTAGNPAGSPQIYTAPANGHVSVVLPVTTRGVAEITSPNTPVSALGIRSHNGAFTSVRSLAIIPGFDDIPASVNRIISGGQSGPVFGQTADWVTIASGDADTNSPSSFVVGRDYNQGRIAAVGHEGLLIQAQLMDNSLFVANMAQWLDVTGQKKAFYTTGHGEVVDSNAVGALRTSLTRRGFSFGALTGTLTSAALSDASVVIIGNAWNDFTAAELQAIESYVSNGGGLLLAGLGWSWLSNNSPKTLDDYPMTKVGKLFGVSWLSSTIVDPDPGDQSGGSTIFHTFFPNAKP